MAFAINPPNTTLVDSRGNVRPEWYRFFANIQRILGGDAVQSLTRAPYITYAPSGFLTNEKPLSATSPIALDLGAEANLSLEPSGITADAYGSASQTISVTFDEFGRATGAEAFDLNTDNITEGTTNLFFTQERARESLSAGTGIDYDSATGEIAVDSAYLDATYALIDLSNVAGFTGTVSSFSGGPFEGNGLPAVYSTPQVFYNPSQSPTDDAHWKWVRRSPAGGTAGFVNSPLKSIVTTDAGTESYEWSFTGVVFNYANQGENVGGYLQGRMFAAGSTWGAVGEGCDLSNLSSAGRGELIGIEADCYFNHDDTDSKRTGLLVVAGDAIGGKTGVAGAPGYAVYGIRIVNQSGFAACKFQLGVFEAAATLRSFQAASTATEAYSITGSYTYGLDLSNGTVSTAAIRLKSGDKLFWTVFGTSRQYHDGTGVAVTSSLGALRFRTNDDGTYQSQMFTVATLPTAGIAGRRTSVSDANATTFYSAVAGGGANNVPVYDNGTNWVIA